MKNTLSKEERCELENYRKITSDNVAKEIDNIISSSSEGLLITKKSQKRKFSLLYDLYRKNNNVVINDMLARLKNDNIPDGITKDYLSELININTSVTKKEYKRIESYFNHKFKENYNRYRVNDKITEILNKM